MRRYLALYTVPYADIELVAIQASDIENAFLIARELEPDVCRRLSWDGRGGLLSVCASRYQNDWVSLPIPAWWNGPVPHTKQL